MTNKPSSFYKRSLPDSCTAFSSQPGKEIFASALANHGLKSFYSLIQQFSTQTEPAYCGLTTLVLILNALSVDPLVTWKGPWRWFSEEMLNCCVALDEVKQSGITLQDFSCLARCQGLTVDLVYADEGDLAQFRKAVQEACVETNKDEGTGDVADKLLAVSYSRKVLSQTGSGHFSPIAAYDPVSDQVLILDTARFKYGAHWTKLELVYDAMKPVDAGTGKSRGYALMSFTPATHRCCPPGKIGDDQSMVAVQPVSLLFATRLNQSPARKDYKEYLSSLEEVTWERVSEYWSDNNGSPSRLWSILEPLPRQKAQEQQEAAQRVHQLIEELLQKNYDVQPATCDSQKEKTCNSPHHALFVVYLASMEEASRVKIVQCAETQSRLTIEELLNEAALIATAIETSDQTDLCGCCNR